MAKNHEVKVTLLADAEPLKRGFGSASQSSTKLEGALKKFGPVGTIPQGIIDKVSLSSVTSAVAIAGGITAALGILSGVRSSQPTLGSDDVAWYDHVPSASKVLAHYHAEPVPKETARQS